VATLYNFSFLSTADNLFDILCTVRLIIFDQVFNLFIKQNLQVVRFVFVLESPLEYMVSQVELSCTVTCVSHNECDVFLDVRFIIIF